MADDDKKPFYKKWWFWLIVIIVLLFAFFGGGDDEEPQDTDTGTENAQKNDNDDGANTGDEAEENAAEEEEPAKEEEPAEEEEPNTRDNSSAKETTLNAGTFAVGPDIPAGRYVITGDGMGNLFVYDEAGLPVINEILDNSGDMGVSTVTTDLEDGQEIEISGLNAVKFTPAETKISNTLSAGTWEVGLDIEPGRYDATAPSGMGNFFIYNDMGLPTTNEILDASGEMGVKKVTVTLKEGQKIEISGLNEVKFEAK